MSIELSRNQRIIAIVSPIVVVLVGWAAHAFLGTLGLVFVLALVCMVLVFLILELRNYTLGLSLRQHTESKAFYSQIEALIGITTVLGPQVPLPSMRGWAASPDLLREVVVQVFEDTPSLVLEASSGTSTLILAYALERMGKGKVIALDHEQVYAERTRRMLELHGLSHRAIVVHAPLVEHTTANGVFWWYDISNAGIDAPIDLVLVDGPPETTRPMARYPAVPILFKHLAHNARVILDDGGRADERSTADRWLKEYNATSSEFLQLEKGAWLLRFGGPSA